MLVTMSNKELHRLPVIRAVIENVCVGVMRLHNYNLPDIK